MQEKSAFFLKKKEKNENFGFDGSKKCKILTQ